MERTFVIVGGGLAAGKAVEELRGQGFEERIVLVGDEHHLPYERPPLSKGYLAGAASFEEALVHGPEWYDEQGVDLRLGTTVTAVDLARHEVRARGGSVTYDRLLLATGVRPRRLAMADDSGAPVAYLRTPEDSDRIREAFGDGRRVTLIGAGWIGLEVAAAARQAGCEVTVLETLDQPLERVLGPEVGARFADLHRQHGVDVRTGIRVEAVEPAVGGRATVRLGDGTSIGTDLLVVGVGVTPNDALAREAGLATDNGVLVDAGLRTSDPEVFAAGDVANHDHPRLGRRIRVEHWDTAIEQGKAAARAMLGSDAPYDRLPYFFSDQYDLGMEYVGSTGPDGYDEVVVRPGSDAATWTAFWLLGDMVLAAMHANDWDATEHLWRIVGQQVPIDALRDPGTMLGELSVTAP